MTYRIRVISRCPKKIMSPASPPLRYRIQLLLYAKGHVTPHSFELAAAIEAATIAIHDRECPEAGWCVATPTSMDWYRLLAAAAVRAAAPIIAAQAVAAAQTCTCQAWPPEGPSPDCTVHGAVRAFNETTTRLIEVERERDEARAELERLNGRRILSVVFGHHKGAPRPFALRAAGTGEREPQHLGAQWPNGFVVVQGLEGGAMPWRSIDDLLADWDGVEVVWLSDELPSLAEMEQECDALRVRLATAERDALLRAAEDLPRTGWRLSAYAWLRERAKGADPS